jgi:hypothetical protein
LVNYRRAEVVVSKIDKSTSASEIISDPFEIDIENSDTQIFSDDVILDEFDPDEFVSDSSQTE